MHQEATDELAGLEAHNLLPLAGLDAVVFPAEGDRIGIGADEAVVRDRDPLSWFALQTTAGQRVGVSAEIGQHRLGATKRGFGVYHPLGFAQWSEVSSEGIWIGETCEISKEGQFTRAMQRHQPFDEQAPKQPRQNADMQE